MSFQQGVKVLHIDASGRGIEQSGSRKLSARLVEGLKSKYGATVVTRDIAQGLPFVNEKMIESYFAQGERTEEQKKAVEVSDALVKEILEADVIVFGSPIYNFGVPAVLKAYADLIARVGITFKYGEKGPEGLVSGKRVFTCWASGGTALGSDYDHASKWWKVFLAFLGMTDVTYVDGTKGAVEAGEKAVDALLA